MAKKEFIFQGFTLKTHGEEIARLFDVPDIERVLFSVAFVNSGGVDFLKNQLSRFGSLTTAFIGIRNEITSTQGAKRLREFGVRLFAVDTGARHVVFHPKLYLAKGARQARMIVGSANLTLGGLNNNIEAGVAIDFDLSDKNNQAFIAEIEAVFDSLAASHPANVLAIAEGRQLDALQAAGRLIDELSASPPRPVSAGITPSQDEVPRIKLRVKALQRSSRGAEQPISRTPARIEGASTSNAVPAAIGVEFELVWESKALTRRDLNVPDGKTTNRTGSINLDKGQLPKSINHRHYFRNEVFAALPWTASSRPKIEEVHAKFQLVLKGISYGEFDLRIAHSSDTASRTYTQNNASTRLSWGPMREYVARTDLIGRDLALYRDRADPKRFLLEID